ncbi:MAG: hypothetical protein R2795_06180 [Saprospiraceae bacterium]
MRYYRGTGLATLALFQWLFYGDLSGNKELTVFAKSIDGDTLSLPHFSDRRIWKNYASFD